MLYAAEDSPRRCIRLCLRDKTSVDLWRKYNRWKTSDAAAVAAYRSAAFTASSAPLSPAPRAFFLLSFNKFCSLRACVRARCGWDTHRESHIEIDSPLRIGKMFDLDSRYSRLCAPYLTREIFSIYMCARSSNEMFCIVISWYIH